MGRYLVTYYTISGNTRRVAEAIHASLEGDNRLLPMEEVQSLEGFTLVFIGFPVMQFGVPAPVAAFIAQKATGIRIALFVTHAIMTGSQDLVQRTMLEKELAKCRRACSNADLAGLFHCQGELSEKMAADMLATNMPSLAGFARMRGMTLGHPDEAELSAAGAFAREMTLTG
jgi:hypothetical protein